MGGTAIEDRKKRAGGKWDKPSHTDSLLSLEQRQQEGRGKEFLQAQWLAHEYWGGFTDLPGSFTIDLILSTLIPEE